MSLRQPIEPVLREALEKSRTAKEAELIVPKQQAVGEVIRAEISEVLNASNLQIQGLMNGMKETIRQCEAEFEWQENVNVVVEEHKTMLAIERKLRFAKDRP